MRKKSKYRQKYIPGTLPITFAMSQEMRNDLELTPLGMLESFREGTGTEEGYETIVAAINLAAVLSRAQSREAQEVIEKGMEAVLAIMERFKSSRRWGVSGDDYRAIGEALTLGTEMTGISSRREVAVAIQTVLDEAAI